MDVILGQIERALDRGFHYLAIVSALTLPDLCAALEAANGETTKAAYRGWYDAWLAPKYPMISRIDIYRLRSGVVHQGILGPNGMQYDRIVFTIHGHGAIIHGNLSANNAGVQGSALQLDAGIFCSDVIESVRQWYSAKKDDPIVKANMPRLLRFRPHGSPPHFVSSK